GGALSSATPSAGVLVSPAEAEPMAKAEKRRKQRREQREGIVLAAVPSSLVTQNAVSSAPPVPIQSAMAASPAPRHRGSRIPKQRPPLVGSVALAAAAAAASLPQASGMEVITCSADGVTQQCIYPAAQ
ncbi:MAG: hypothetical protein ACKPKO_13890, partial [Candidatus Fonsibacter sp.]